MAYENNIVDNIMNYRSKQGFLQEIYANKSGVKYTTLTKFESGVIKEHQFGYGENRHSVWC